MIDYSKKTLEELKKEEDRLQERYSEIEDDCAKEGLSYFEFMERAKDVKERLYFVSKYIRLNSEPAVEYGKEWRGDIYTLDEFIKNCQNGNFIDSDGYGYYSAKDAKSDIEVLPSDILEGIYRKDFTHVIWFNK